MSEETVDNGEGATAGANVAVASADLKQLLVEMRSGEVSNETRSRALALLRSVDATTLALMEQQLMEEGVSHEEIRSSLCDIHLEMIKDSLQVERQEVPEGHPIHTFMEEHKIILGNLELLAGVVERVERAESLEALGEDLATLEEVAHHLVETESHHQREEETLFLALERHGVTEPPAVMKADHVEFLARKRALYRLARSPGEVPFEEFREGVIVNGGYIAEELKGHIFKEDNILYQIALQILTAEDWKEVQRECDKIGYCCFSPGSGPECSEHS